MSVRKGLDGQLVGPELASQDPSDVRRTRGLRSVATAEFAGREMRGAVDRISGSLVDGTPAADGASVEPPDLPSLHPVLGAALRPPLTGTGQLSSLVSDALREALAAQPSPADRYVDGGGQAYEVYPDGASTQGQTSPYVASSSEPQPGSAVPSPYAEFAERPGRYVGPPVPAPDRLATAGFPPGHTPAVTDRSERELWFRPRGEQPVEPLTDPSTVAIALPPNAPADGALPAGSLAAGSLAADGVTALVRPAPRDLSVTVPEHEPARPAQALSRRARRAAEHAASGAGSGRPDAGGSMILAPATMAPAPDLRETADGDDWVGFPSYARPASTAAPSPQAGEPLGPGPEVSTLPRPGFLPSPQPPPAVSGPLDVPGCSHARRHVPDVPGGPSTSSIPLVRPPVQVRRPDEDVLSVTTETRSLRVTPPEAKALFRTPVAPKGGDGASGGTTSTTTTPPATNLVPPSPAPAPSRPVSPKPQTSGEPGPEPDPGSTRRVVVVPGAASGNGTVAASTPPSTPTATESASAPSAAASPTWSKQEGRPALEQATVDWLGELCAEGAATTVVPAKGRGARKSRKAAKANGSSNGSPKDGRRGKRGSGEDLGQPEVPPMLDPGSNFADLEDLNDGGRGRWLSFLVVWAPALVLLLLAGVVVWLVR
jgi:hypothetical protein